MTSLVFGRRGGWCATILVVTMTAVPTSSGSAAAGPLTYYRNVTPGIGTWLEVTLDTSNNDLLAGWGPCPSPPTPCLADLDNDGAVSVLDFLILLASWG